MTPLSSHQARRLSVVLLCAACAPSLPLAETAVSAAVHAERVAQLKTLLSNCSQHPPQCDPARVGPDEFVRLDSGTVTRVRFDWLRQGIGRLGKEAGKSRAILAQELDAQFARIQDAGGATAAGAFPQAREQFDRVLAAREFAPEPEPNWVERKWRQFLRWLGNLLSKSFEAISRTPDWIRLGLQCLLFLVPALLLGLWLIRQVREDRRYPVDRADPRQQSDLPPPIDWQLEAEQFVRECDWRQAIHALYWATIADLERRKVWTRSRARTPREYLRLLEDGSPARAALFEQTSLFEVTWYGYRTATMADCARAAQLRAAMGER